jgi:hypothetical protein
MVRTGLAALLAAAAIAAVGIAVAHGGSPHKSSKVALPGLQRTPAPWAPEYAHLPDRVAALGLPPVSDVVYHVHALLHVYVDGRPIPVPADVGIDFGRGYIASLHTHDETGVIHVEATRPYPFRLSDFFAVWGVAFGRDRLGGYRSRGARRVWVFVNGRPVVDPVHYVMRRHDDIVVAYGRAGSFPRRPSTAALAGL